MDATWPRRCRESHQPAVPGRATAPTGPSRRLHGGGGGGARDMRSSTCLRRGGKGGSGRRRTTAAERSPVTCNPDRAKKDSARKRERERKHETNGKGQTGREHPVAIP